MSERLDALRREIEREKQLAMAELGLRFTSPLIVRGNDTPGAVIERHLARVPDLLKAEAKLQMAKHVIWLPWLTSRQLKTDTLSVEKTSVLPMKQQPDTAPCSVGEMPGHGNAHP